MLVNQHSSTGWQAAGKQLKTLQAVLPGPAGRAGLPLSQKAALERLARPEADIVEMGLECHRPLGAFYAFPSVAKFGLPAKEFSLQLLREEKVAVVPGTAFGACGEGFVRCAYATNME